MNANLSVAAASQTVTVEAGAPEILENTPTTQTTIDVRTLKLPNESTNSGLSSIIANASPGVAADSNGFFHPLGDSIRIVDVLRPEAKAAVVAMRQMGLKMILLSGDAQEVTTFVGKDLGVDEAVGELLPDQKARWVGELRRNSRKVAMIGDGINDAPALVEANVGIAMGAGTDVARESADVILIGNNLSRLVETLRIARRCRGIIMQNFIGTLAVDTAGISLAAVGLLNPLLAAFIHIASELAFILNSTRLLPGSRRRSQA